MGCNLPVAVSIPRRAPVVNPPALDNTPADALAAALPLVAAGFPVLPVAPRTKRPAVKAWQYSVADIATDPTLCKCGAAQDPRLACRCGHATDADTARRWFGPGGQYEGYGVAIATRAAGAFAIDLDDDAAADRWRAELEAGGGMAPTFIIESRRGAKIMLRRDGSPVPPDANGNKAGKLWPHCDVVAGYVVAWSPGRTWRGSPAVVADCPAWLATLLAPLYADRSAGSVDGATTPAHERRAAGAGLGVGLAMSWGDGEFGRALASACDAIARAPEGARHDTLYAKSFAIGGMIGDRPDDAARPYLEDAGRAAGLPAYDVVRTVADGLRAGREHPLPPPVSATCDAIDNLAAAEVRAAAVAASARIRPGMAELADRRAKHRRHTVVRLARALLAIVAERGTLEFKAGLAGVARRARVSLAAASRACNADALAPLGWTWTPGDAETMAPSSWQWAPGIIGVGGIGQNPRQDPNTVPPTPIIPPASVGLDDAYRATGKIPTADALSWAVQKRARRGPAGVLTRARARRAKSNADPVLPGRAWGADVLLYLRGRDGTTAADVADAFGLSRRAAASTLSALEVRGLASSSPIATGRRGRPALAYRATGDADILAAELEYGTAVYARRLASDDARTERCKRALRAADERGEPVAAVLARQRAEAEARLERYVDARQRDRAAAEVRAVAVLADGGRHRVADPHRSYERGSFISLERADDDRPPAVPPPTPDRVTADQYLAAIAL